MHEQSHTVVRVPVHLPDSQNVYFKNDAPEAALIEAELRNCIVQVEQQSYYNKSLHLS